MDAEQLYALLVEVIESKGLTINCEGDDSLGQACQQICNAIENQEEDT